MKFESEGEPIVSVPLLSESNEYILQPTLLMPEDGIYDGRIGMFVRPQRTGNPAPVHGLHDVVSYLSWL